MKNVHKMKAKGRDLMFDINKKRQVRQRNRIRNCNYLQAKRVCYRFKETRTKKHNENIQNESDGERFRI